MEVLQMQISASPREIFPLFRQLLYDAFQTDALLFTWPYENVEQIDNSIRKTLWGSSRYAPLELLDHADITSAHHIVIFKSSLRFYNMICLLSSDSHSDFISIGPFRDQEVTSSFLSQTARDNHLTGESLSVMKKYYSTMPLADPESVASFASHFLSAFLPDYDKIPPVYFNFSETDHKIVPDQELLFSQTSRYAEQYARGYQETIDALFLGDFETTSRSLRSWLSVTGLLKEMHTGRLRRNLAVLNEIFASALLSCPVHPVYIRELAHEIQVQIENTENYEMLCALPGRIARKYCLLVKNQSHSDYSALTRRVMDYIRIHLAEDLSLSVIARECQRHPASLSGYFRKETGMTITTYIRQERVRRAVNYLNISSLEIREIASRVGFHDLGYFSRVFREQMGVSPSQYRKTFTY